MNKCFLIEILSKKVLSDKFILRSHRLEIYNYYLTIQLSNYVLI